MKSEVGRARELSEKVRWVYEKALRGRLGERAGKRMWKGNVGWNVEEV